MKDEALRNEFSFYFLHCTPWYKSKMNYIHFQAPTTSVIHTEVFWVLILYSNKEPNLLGPSSTLSPHFDSEWPYSLKTHLHNWPTSSPNHLIPTPWRCRHSDPLKQWCSTTVSHGVKTDLTTFIYSTIPKYDIYSVIPETRHAKQGQHHDFMLQKERRGEKAVQWSMKSCCEPVNIRF